MAHVGAQANKGVWGLCPQWDPGAKPLVEEVRGRSSQKLMIFKCFECNFLIKLYSTLLLHVMPLITNLSDPSVKSPTQRMTASTNFLSCITYEALNSL